MTSTKDKINNTLHITRTIWVSCLSHFLLLPLLSRQICNGCCTRTRASARNKALYTVINPWFRDNLYRDTAPVPANNFVTGDNFADPIKFVPRHS